MTIFSGKSVLAGTSSSMPATLCREPIIYLQRPSIAVTPSHQNNFMAAALLKSILLARQAFFNIPCQQVEIEGPEEAGSAYEDILLNFFPIPLPCCPGTTICAPLT